MSNNEFINRVEIKGRIGHEPQIINVGGKKVARFAIVTENASRNANGSIVCDATWHNVIAWEGPGIAPFHSPCKGRFAHIKGRIRNTRFTDSSGNERTIQEIVAEEMKVNQ